MERFSVSWDYAKQSESARDGSEERERERAEESVSEIEQENIKK